MSTVELQSVTKIFDKTVKALDNITFTVKDGEFFVLLGPTGAGKTTTLRAIAGLEKVDQGKILFDQNKALDGTPRKVVKISLAKKYGWNAIYSFEEGLKITLKDFIKNYKSYVK